MELVVYGESDGEREQSAHFHDREIIFRVKPLHFCTTCFFIIMHMVDFSTESLFPILACEALREPGLQSYTVHSPGLSQDLLRGVLCLSPLCMR